MTRAGRRIWRLWCAPGLEELVAAELSELVGVEGRTVHAGVTARLSDREALVVLARSRLAERVLVQLGSFDAVDRGELRAGLGGLDWASVLDEGTPVRIRVKVGRSRLRHEGAVRDAVLRAATDQVADVHLSPDGSEGAPQLLDVSVQRDRVMVWVDAAGEGLDRRGWRRNPGGSPLRTTLAAAALRAGSWPDHPVLVDPFCGSGTILVEAARTASGAFPWTPDREFAVWGWPSFRAGTWASATTAAPAAPAMPRIVGSDRDPGAVAAAVANLESAAVAALVEVSQGPVSAVEAPSEGPGLVVANPPWGERTRQGNDPRDLWATFGRVLVERFGGWSFVLLASNEHLVHATRLDQQVAFETSAGGRRLRAHVGIVPG